VLVTVVLARVGVASYYVPASRAAKRGPLRVCATIEKKRAGTYGRPLTKA
jgi:hypothetical protein